MMNTSVQELVQFMGEFCRRYVASGGPTSRLEDSLFSLGKELGFHSEVFATPTGVFVSAYRGNEHASNLCRIRESGIHLERLCWLEGLLDDVISKKISLKKASKILHSKHLMAPTYTKLTRYIAAFFAGVALSYSAYGKLPAAPISGFIAAMTWLITGPLLEQKIQSSMFRDFIGCFVTLFLASVFQLFFPAPFDAYSIGGIVMLVPGLALTNAVAELADQNLISGTAKLMQAVFTLLALGVAYLIFTDLSQAMNFGSQAMFATRKINQPFLQSLLFVGISITCFGIIFRVPRKSLAWATLTGLLGWLTLKYFNATTYNSAAPFMASLIVGLTSLGLSKFFRVPSQVFSVPGILGLLPGLLALTSVQSFAMGKQNNGLEIAFNTALVASSIAFGLFTARIPFAIQRRKPNEPQSIEA